MQQGDKSCRCPCKICTRLRCRYDQLRAELSQAQELASAEEQRRVVDAATAAISRLGEALNPAGLSRAQRVVHAITEPQVMEGPLPVSPCC